MRVMPALLLVLSAAAALPGCNALNDLASRAAIANTTFALQSASLDRADVPLVTPNGSAGLTLVLGVTNPNPIAAALDRLDYRLSLQGEQVASGSTSRSFSVQAGQTAPLSLPITVPYAGVANLATQIWPALQARHATVGLGGTAHVSTPIGTIDVPVSVSRDLAF